MARLESSTWNTHASNLQPFLEFLADCNIQPDMVENHHIEQFICWLFESAKYSLRPTTLQSYIATVRTCFREAGVALDSKDPGAAGAIAGYTKVFSGAVPPPPDRPPWPAKCTERVLRAVLDHWKHLCMTKFQRRRQFVIDGMHVIFAYITFCRGGSTGAAKISDLTFSKTGMHVQVTKQKRAKSPTPMQFHPFRGNTAHCPARLMQQYVGYLLQPGCTRDDLLFGTKTKQRRSKHAPGLNKAVKSVINYLHPPQGPVPFTGHCIRIGSISTAYAIGAPLLTCATQAGHSDTKSTEAYARHSVPVDSTSMYYFEHLLPAALRTTPIHRGFPLEWA